MRWSILFLAIFLPFLVISCDKKSEAPAIRAELGRPAPDFTLLDTKGRSWRLSDLRGNVVFVNFWATWCPPCREEMPSMQALNQEMAKEPFKMLAILANDNPSLGENFVNRLGGAFPVLIDPRGETGRAYGITGVPETFIVDAAGVLREKIIGPRPWDSVEAKNLIRRYLP